MKYVEQHYNLKKKMAWISMLEIVSEWNELAGNKIADYILYKKETEIISKEDLNNMVDVALKYNPNCVDALKLKIDYLKMKRIK